MRLEIGGEIQERLREPAARDEKEDHENAAQAPVAVDERVDGFELRVSHGTLDEIGQPVALGQESLQLVERRTHLRYRRRNVRRSGQCGAGRPDPVLRGPELARRPRRGRFSVQQALVQAAHQSQIERQPGDTLDAVDKCRQHVAHPGELVGVGAGGSRSDLVEQDLRKAHVGALDTRAAEGFLAQERRRHRRRARQLVTEPG